MPEIDNASARRMSAFLRKENKFVVDAPESHNKGFSKSGKPRYVLSKRDDTKRAIVDQLYDPMSIVKHCVSRQATPVTEHKLTHTVLA